MELSAPVIIGNSLIMTELKNRIRKVADTDFNVLISGEAGVGKDVIAQALHFMSYRKARPFIKVNCGETPAELLESELFGNENASVSGTARVIAGKLERAHGGTIFLDQIDAMHLTLQAKVLLFLEGREFSPLNSKKTVKVDCWVLTATRGDLEELTEEGLFLEDLCRRLNIIRVVIPPLRQWQEDIEPLIYYFAEKFSTEAQKPYFEFSDDGIMDRLRQYSWPGNVTELQNTVTRLLRVHDWEAVEKKLAHGGQQSKTGTLV
jgi:DNA-binding NtrC family response regulator